MEISTQGGGRAWKGIATFEYINSSLHKYELVENLKQHLFLLIFTAHETDRVGG